MNPYDLNGPEFLGLYVGLFAAVMVGAELLRWRLRTPGPEIDRYDPNLTPYETAYLADGRNGAVYAAVAALLRKNVLLLNENRQLNVTDPNSFSGITHPLEWAVYEQVKQTGNLRVRLVNPAEALNQIRASLEERGLLVGSAQQLPVRLLPAMLYLGLALFGLGKIFVGVDRHKPVGFLIFLVVITGLLALGRLFAAGHRSRRGDDLLNRLRARNAALKSSLKSSPAAIGADDTALGVALFGTAILMGGPHDALARAIQPPSGGGGGEAGGGCGGGGCGGGCGGGGCGGCGG